MKILKNAGWFEILTPEDVLLDQLLSIERAGRTCYQSEKQEITLESAMEFARMVLKRGHESVIEHGIMTVRFNDVSRGLTHEVVRHRLSSFSQESTRFVDYVEKKGGPNLDKFELKCVVPPHLDEQQKVRLEDGRELSMAEMLAESEMFYRALRKSKGQKFTPEDARQVLPIGIKSQIVVSANPREWRHIFGLRTGKPAHWEIRKVMGDLLVAVQKIVPVIFDDFQEAGVDNHGLRYFKKQPDYFKNS